jgi:hypothetical protein
MFDQLEVFDDDFKPASPVGGEIQAADLADGEYTFEIVEAKIKMPKGNTLLELLLQVLTPGDHEGKTLAQTYWLNDPEDAARVGRVLLNLGFDADRWQKALGRPFSKELPKAVRLLPGLRVQATKKINEVAATATKPARTFHNIYLNKRAPTDGKPATFGPQELNQVADEEFF